MPPPHRPEPEWPGNMPAHTNRLPVNAVPGTPENAIFLTRRDAKPLGFPILDREPVRGPASDVPSGPEFRTDQPRRPVTACDFQGPGIPAERFTGPVTDISQQHRFTQGA